MFGDSFGMKKNSHYTKFFEHAIDDLRENGQLHIYEQRHSNDNQDLKCKNKISEGKSLGFYKLISIFLLYISGTLFGFFILILEYLFKPKKQCHLSKIHDVVQDIENAMANVIPCLNGYLKVDSEKCLEDLKCLKLKLDQEVENLNQ